MTNYSYSLRSSPPEVYESTQESFAARDAVEKTPSPSSHPPTYRVTHNTLDENLVGGQQLQKLQFLALADWDEQNSYDEVVPTCLHYSIEWKVSVNNKVISRDTEPDLVLLPTAHWHMCLKPKLEGLLQKKLTRNRQVRCEDTNVVVSVSDRTERDLVKRFDDLSIDWSMVEKKFLGWSELFRSGKKLRVELTFNYVDSHQPATAAKKGRSIQASSATQLMLGDRAAQLDAEHEITGQPSVWREVYALMKCTGPPCNLGPYCWREPVGKRHFKLRTHQLKELVKYVEQGKPLQSHEDVPEDIREQLFAEERQRLEREPKAARHATPFPPINITNVLPPYQSPAASSIDSESVSSLCTTKPISLHIPGPRDVAVRSYSEWQQSNVVDVTLKAEYQKACDMALDDGLDLDQVYGDQDSTFFIRNGVKRGVARRFVTDIEDWAKRFKASHDDSRDTSH
jgi:hypothetical protein